MSKGTPHIDYPIDGCWCTRCVAHMAAELKRYSGRATGDDEALAGLMIQEEVAEDWQRVKGDCDR